MAEEINKYKVKLPASFTKKYKSERLEVKKESLALRIREPKQALSQRCEQVLEVDLICILLMGKKLRK